MHRNVVTQRNYSFTDDLQITALIYRYRAAYLQISHCISANKHAWRSAGIYVHTSQYRSTDILHITLNPQTSYWLYADKNTTLTLTTLQMPHSKSHVLYYGITTTTLQIYRNDASDLQMLALQTCRCHTTMDRYTTDINKIYLLSFKYMSMGVRATGNTRFLPVQSTEVYYTDSNLLYFFL